MPVFNDDITGYQEMKDWMPVFYRDIKEMNANMQLEGLFIDKMSAALERLVSNAFINTADQNMIARLEKFLKLTENANRSLEERRNALASAWIGYGKLSVSKIISVIKQYLGDRTDVSVKFTTRFYFYINSLNVNPLIDEDISKYLRRVMPAALAYELIYQVPNTGVSIIGGALQMTDNIMIRQVV